MSERVEFEIVSAELGFLEGRFRIDGREIMCAVHWDGSIPIEVAVKRVAIDAIREIRRPPRPTKEMLRTYVGYCGHVDVEVPG